LAELAAPRGRCLLPRHLLPLPRQRRHWASIPMAGSGINHPPAGPATEHLQVAHHTVATQNRQPAPSKKGQGKPKHARSNSATCIGLPWKCITKPSR
jgi:hypothetical protein